MREERKATVGALEEERLRRLLCRLLQPDPHGVEGVYEVRSLYFDDPEDTAVHVKTAGLSSRHKWRLRIYDRSDRRIRLERKARTGRRVRKDAALVDRAMADALALGELDAAWAPDQASDPLVQAFAAEMAARRLRPAVVVDYVREAWLHPSQSLRITLDRRLCRHAWPGRLRRDWLDPELPLQRVLGRTILEVKSTGGLPAWIASLLPARALSEALSKYVLCRHPPAPGEDP